VKALVEDIRGALKENSQIARYVGDSLRAQVEKVYIEMGGKAFLPANAAQDAHHQHAHAHGTHLDHGHSH
jgi:hypothetical protein